MAIYVPLSLSTLYWQTCLWGHWDWLLAGRGAGVWFWANSADIRTPLLSHKYIVSLYWPVLASPYVQERCLHSGQRRVSHSPPQSLPLQQMSGYPQHLWCSQLPPQPVYYVYYQVKLGLNVILTVMLNALTTLTWHEDNQPELVISSVRILESWRPSQKFSIQNLKISHSMWTDRPRSLLVLLQMLLSCRFGLIHTHSKY